MSDEQGLRTQVVEAVARARKAVLAEQQSDGSWRTGANTGPAATAQYLAVLKWLGELDAGEAKKCVAYLWTRQLPDGGFAAYPGSAQSDLVTTATAYAGLVAGGEQPAGERMQRVWHWLRAKGGVQSLDPFTQTFLVMVGVVDPGLLPSIPTSWVLVPGMDWFLSQRLMPAITVMFYQLPVVLKKLRARVSPPGSCERCLDALSGRVILRYLTEHQDPTGGSWMTDIMHSLLGLAALDALGVSRSDSRFTRALASLQTLRTELPDGSVRYAAFTAELWDTAVLVSALVAAGEPADGAALRKAAGWLVSWQSRVDSPRDWQTPACGAPRQGGWAFEPYNVFASDCDSSSEVLRALSVVSRATRDPELARSLDKGLAWERGMQNSDGGWASFTHGHPGKPPGPINLDVPMVPEGLAAVMMVLDPALAYGDPAMEDVTGRVLDALGTLGLREGDPSVARGVSFLRDQLGDNGVWWGRWECNYVPSTAYILVGLARVGVALSDPAVAGALAWLLSRQNADGGWGETVDSYANLTLAGVGPSSAYLTGLCLSALVATGQGSSAAASRAAAFLLAKQLPGGLWSQENYELVMQPPVPYYRIRSNAMATPLEGLGEWLAANA